MRSWIGSLLLALAVVPISGRQAVSQSRPPSAPTFYIAVAVDTCERDGVRVRGVTNVPPRSVVGLEILDFNGEGWKEYSSLAHAVVDSRGFFAVRIRPKPGLQFHHNLVASAEFAPSRDPQPKEVWELVGRKGENLGGLDNPQVEQWSGWQYYLAAIARVPGCGPTDLPPAE